uniref:Uncharacterized protein n=1 Tax=Acrobeloides nanus TaxID=290746 RepID=A0A914EC98_9BILA
MLEANLNFIVKTKEVVEKLLKWNVLCALEKDCYAPPDVDSHTNGLLFCHFKDIYKDFGDCHRYDQSAINILLLNMNGYDYHFYASEMTDFFKIDRDIVPPVDINELKCTKKGIK